MGVAIPKEWDISVDLSLLLAFPGRGRDKEAGVHSRRRARGPAHDSHGPAGVAFLSRSQSFQPRPKVHRPVRRADARYVYCDEGHRRPSTFRNMSLGQLGCGCSSPLQSTRLSAQCWKDFSMSIPSLDVRSVTARQGGWPFRTTASALGGHVVPGHSGLECQWVRGRCSQRSGPVSARLRARLTDTGLSTQRPGPERGRARTSRQPLHHLSDHARPLGERSGSLHHHSIHCATGCACTTTQVRLRLAPHLGSSPLPWLAKSMVWIPEFQLPNLSVLECTRHLRAR